MSTPWSRIAPARRELLESLVAEFRHNYGKGRTLLGVDGPTAAGKTTFAADLTLAFERSGLAAFHASMNGFNHPREHRYRAGRLSPEGYYRDAFDNSLFRRVLAEPFRMGGSAGFQLAAFDLQRDVPLESEWTTAPADAVLVVDGMFLQRPELRGLWNYTIWLDADAAVRQERLVARDGADPDPEAASNQRWSGAMRIYVRDTAPNAAASAIVDNTDPDHPKRMWADFCTIAPAPL
jgi:uridine kinase